MVLLVYIISGMLTECLLRRVIRPSVCTGFKGLLLPRRMSHSKYEYVRRFEADDRLLPNAWIVIRIDGKGFHKFSTEHNFTKPNDVRALHLMNASAECVLKDLKDILMAYGQSDEYSFIFRRDTDLYSRRASKLMTSVVSLFAAAYVFQWKKYFPDQELLRPPAFDSRAVLYPTNKNLRDYLSWRQVDCHVNNLYNTTFWALVQQGDMTNTQAQERLKNTFSNDKNEILFTDFGINYNNEPQQFRKGTIVYKKKSVIPKDVEEEEVPEPREPERKLTRKERKKEMKMAKQNVKVLREIIVEHTDIIGDSFWLENTHLIDDFQD